MNRPVRTLAQRAAIPYGASPEIAPAPARGPVVIARQWETVMTPSGPRVRARTVDGAHPVRLRDAFDVMTAQVARRTPGALPPFAEHQIEAGRTYAALVERCAAEGTCGARAGDGSGSGGGRFDWIDGVIARSMRLQRMREAIGEARVIGEGWRLVTARQLVDLVAVQGLTVSEVLHWAGVGRGVNSARKVRDGLGAALDRLHGI